VSSWTVPSQTTLLGHEQSHSSEQHMILPGMTGMLQVYCIGLYRCTVSVKRLSNYFRSTRTCLTQGAPGGTRTAIYSGSSALARGSYIHGAIAGSRQPLLGRVASLAGNEISRYSASAAAGSGSTMTVSAISRDIASEKLTSSSTSGHVI